MVDTCSLASPMLPAGVERLMTNSAKYAYYAPGLLAAQDEFGGLQDWYIRPSPAGTG